MCARNASAGTSRKLVGAATAEQQERLISALCCVREDMFTDLSLHGNTKWRPLILVQAAVLWAWGQDTALRERWKLARQTLHGWFPEVFLSRSYQGFINALARHTDVLLKRLKAMLHPRTQGLAGGKHWLIAGRAAFAIDGTKVGVPWSDDTDRKLGNETLSPQAKQRRRRRQRRSANSRAHLDIRPQILLTLAWHLGTGLPWSWKLGPVTGSERQHACQLLEELPPRSLLVMDAGFTGYEFWRDVIAEGHDFVVRVGSNVKLLKKLGWKTRVRGELVYLWPDRAARRQERPLVLRLLKIQGPRSSIFVVTTLLSKSSISDKQLCEIYQKRWGIEGWFRSLKQTFGRSKMRSLTSQPALCELHWSIVGLALIQLQGVEALAATGKNPHDLSEAAAIRIVCSTVLHPDVTFSVLRTLRQRLQTALVDQYQRSEPKSGRHVHRQRQTTAAAEPNIINATRAQQRAACQLQALQQAA